MLGQRMSILQLWWLLLSLLTVEERLARLAEEGSSASREVLEGGFFERPLQKGSKKIAHMKITLDWVLSTG